MIEREREREGENYRKTERARKKMIERQREQGRK